MPSDHPIQSNPKSHMDQIRWKYYCNAAYYRGAFLDLMNWIDWYLDHIIGWYLCPEKTRRTILVDTILHNAEHMPMSNKIKLLRIILKSAQPGEEISHKDLLKRLDLARQMRNKMAHQMLATSADEDHMAELVEKQQLEFMSGAEFGNRKVTQSREEREQWLGELSQLMSWLAKVFQDVGGKSAVEFGYPPPSMGYREIR